MTTLRSALFAEGRALFAAERLSFAFRAVDGEVFEPVVVDVWLLNATSAMATLRWTAPHATEIAGTRLLDAGVLVDDSDLDAPVRLSAGMDFEYTRVIALEELPAFGANGAGL